MLGVTAVLLVYGVTSPAEPGTEVQSTSLISPLLIGVVGFLLLGLFDDRRALSPIWKGSAQAAVLASVLIAWSPGGRLAMPVNLAMAGVAGIVMLNAWNYLDHADGVFSAIAAISAAALALLFGEGAIDLLAPTLLWGVAGGLVGFLLWNLPPARIFLGDAGSLPIGFLLVFSSLVILDAGPVEALPTSVGIHSLALADLLLVTMARVRAGIHPFRGGRDHSGHRLSARVGSSMTLLLLVLLASVPILFSLTLGPPHPGLMVILLPVFSLLLALGILYLPTPAASSEPVRSVTRKRTGRRRKR